MKQFRKIVFWCHLAVGVTVALVVLVMAATGALLTYERQIVEWADTRGLDGAPPSREARRLGGEALLARAVEQLGGAETGAPASIRWRAEREAPAAVAFGRDRVVFVNAYTGDVLGEGAEGPRAFFRGVEDWHRWLGAEGAGRRAGRRVTGACNLGFLFLVMSGFYLWWPRNPTRKAVRSVTLLRRGLSPRARDFNLHNVVGFWSLVPLFFVVLTGVVVSYPWAGDLVHAAVGGLLEEPAADPTPGDVRGEDASLPLFERAAARVPGWRSVTLQRPAASDATLTFLIDAGTGGQPQTQATLVVDRATGAAVGWEPFAAEPPARRLRAILRFTHTGEVLGVWGQTLAGLVSLGTTVLVWTGLALAWRRFRSWRKRHARATASAGER